MNLGGRMPEPTLAELGKAAVPAARVRRVRAVVARVQQGRKAAPRMSAPVGDWMDYMVRSVVAAVLDAPPPACYRTGDHSVAVLFKLPAFDLSLSSRQQQPEDEPVSSSSFSMLQ